MEKTTKKRVKHAILGVTSVALVAGVTSAMTMAMLSDVDNKENTFTATPNLSVQQVEPKWDGTNPTTTVKYVDPNGETKQKYESGDTGSESAGDYIPNREIAKNPFAINTSESKEFVALRVYYQVLCRRDSKLPYKGDGCCGKDSVSGKYNTSWHTIKPEVFKKYFANTFYNGTEGYNTAYFDRVDSEDGYSEYYYYSDDHGTTMAELDPNYATPEIFDVVTPVESLNNCTLTANADHHMFKVEECEGCQKGNYIVKDIDPVGEDDYLLDKNGDQIVLAVGDDDGLPEFRIVVQTAAIQTTYVNSTGEKTSDTATVKAELAKCFPDVPVKNPVTT